MFEDFTRTRIATSGAAINVVWGGAGPPLLLLHGYPQSHVMWHKVAPAMARHFTVVAPDLRGYGDSDHPPGGADHAGYSKRAMAQDQVEVMAYLGHERFHVAGHDRGGRVGHRMALDHPERVLKLAELDVVATSKVFASIDSRLASAYFHWFLMLQRAPFPEKLIGGDPDFYLRFILEKWCATPGAITEEAWAEYARCFRRPETIHATCEDYRAVGLDLEHDAADGGRKLACPLLVLWGESKRTHPGWPAVLFDILATWRERAENVRGRALDCGHFLPEEAPEEVSKELIAFFSDEKSEAN